MFAARYCIVTTTTFKGFNNTKNTCFVPDSTEKPLAFYHQVLMLTGSLEYGFSFMLRNFPSVHSWLRVLDKYFLNLSKALEYTEAIIW